MSVIDLVRLSLSNKLYFQYVHSLDILLVRMLGCAGALFPLVFTCFYQSFTRFYQSSLFYVINRFYSSFIVVVYLEIQTRDTGGRRSSLTYRDRGT